MNEYITVKRESAGQYIEKHSRFLGFLVPCGNESEAAARINEKRKEYWDARHAVYAYVLADGTARFSDDGEPHGTAGKPVLEVLKSSGIKNAAIIVVRYFGGILLGTGGLVRAYTAAASSAVENAEKTKVSAGDEFSVSASYGDYDKLVFLLREAGADIVKTEFLDSVRVVFSVQSEKSENCLKSIKEAFSSSVLPKFEKKTEIYQKI
ncbi:MAG: YigZ family protein [Clostridia bacterium]|nr:YigZ family protein [Clostridia bacterium]